MSGTGDTFFITISTQVIIIANETLVTSSIEIAFETRIAANSFMSTHCSTQNRTALFYPPRNGCSGITSFFFFFFYFYGMWSSCCLRFRCVVGNCKPPPPHHTDNKYISQLLLPMLLLCFLFALLLVCYFYLIFFSRLLLVVVCSLMLRSGRGRLGGRVFNTQNSVLGKIGKSL